MMDMQKKKKPTETGLEVVKRLALKKKKRAEKAILERKKIGLS